MKVAYSSIWFILIQWFFFQYTVYWPIFQTPESYGSYKDKEHTLYLYFAIVHDLLVYVAILISFKLIIDNQKIKDKL